MPELPEVETMCRCIAGAVGCCIRGVERPKSRLQSISISPRLGEFRRRVVGRTIAAVRRVGKRVVLELEDEHARRPHPNPLPTNLRSVPGEGTDCIVLEPRMSGLVLLADPPDREHLRLIFRLGRLASSCSGRACPPRAEGDAAGKPARYTLTKCERTSGAPEHILFWDQRGLGVARLLSHEQFLRCYGPEQLGPDALAISAETLRERLGGSRRAIKVAMLDQHVLAGVGNLYASEILHLAHIHPATPCRRLTSNEWSRLHVAMKKVLRAAIRHQGSTLRDGTYRIARNRRGNYQVYHRVYQRAGEPCLQCSAARIVRIVQTQRSTFFCPACQRPCSSRPAR